MIYKPTFFLFKLHLSNLKTCLRFAFRMKVGTYWLNLDSFLIFRQQSWHFIIQTVCSSNWIMNPMNLALDILAFLPIFHVTAIYIWGSFSFLELNLDTGWQWPWPPLFIFKLHQWSLKQIFETLTCEIERGTVLSWPWPTFSCMYYWQSEGLLFNAAKKIQVVGAFISSEQV